MLSSVGISGPKSTTYVLENEEATSTFSAFGLWQLLPEEERPTEIWFLLTPKAREAKWSLIEREAAQRNISVRAIDLTGDTDDTSDFLEQTASQIPEGCRLTLSVTEGLRHHSFLFYALALYLTAFRDVHIEGVWYCYWETSDDKKPVIDLKPTLDLANWFHALAVFRETGSLREIARRIPEGEPRDQVEKLSRFFLNGMPVEAGNVASRFIESVHSSEFVSGVPLAAQLQLLILKEIEPLAGATFEMQTNRPETTKRSLPVDERELQREAEFIHRYFRSGQLNLAFGLLREWLINWIVWQTGHTNGWLERPLRESVEHNLGGLAQVHRARPPGTKKEYLHGSVRQELTEQQREWAKRWNRVCDIRNALQHHGMRPAVFELQQVNIEKACSDWTGWQQWNAPPKFGGGHGKLLICPLGRASGVLYSALKHTQPGRALVICSDQSQGAVEEAIQRADVQPEIQTLLLHDTYTGIDEFPALIEAASLWLFESDEIQANLTGGTTLMGVLVNKLVARAAREYQRTVCEFILIDKRPPETQRTDPWVLGQIRSLDKSTANGDPEGVEERGDQTKGAAEDEIDLEHSR